MKKNIFFVGLMLIVIAASFYWGNTPKTENNTSVLIKNEITDLNRTEKTLLLDGISYSGSYDYTDPLEQAFEKARRENPDLEAKVAEYHLYQKEIKRLNNEYSQVVQFYTGYSEFAIAELLQLNDSTQMPALHAMILGLDQEAELQIAIARINALEVERNKLNDYLIGLKIESTLPYFENAAFFAPNEAAQFEALQKEVDRFLAN